MRQHYSSADDTRARVARLVPAILALDENEHGHHPAGRSVPAISSASIFAGTRSEAPPFSNGDQSFFYSPPASDTVTVHFAASPTVERIATVVDP